MSYTQAVKNRAGRNQYTASPTVTFRKDSQTYINKKRERKICYYYRIVFHSFITRTFWNVNSTTKTASASLWIDLENKKIKIQKEPTQNPSTTIFSININKYGTLYASSTMSLTSVIHSNPVLESLIGQTKPATITDTYLEIDL